MNEFGVLGSVTVGGVLSVQFRIPMIRGGAQTWYLVFPRADSSIAVEWVTTRGSPSTWNLRELVEVLLNHVQIPA
jgi:hypothetical protein